MDILNWLRKREEPPAKTKLTVSDVEEQIRQAWWDLYVSNLPRPVVIDIGQDKSETPKELKEGVPSGFSIDPETWVTYFNCKDLPDFPEQDPVKRIEDAKKYCRSIGQHETSHFTVVPGSKRMNVRLVDSGLKGLTRSTGKQAAAVAHLVSNIFGDWTGDYLLGVGKYGREDFTDLTRFRLRTGIEDIAKKTKQPSDLWKVLIGTYEAMFNDDFGLKKYAPLDYRQQEIVKQCVEIMGDNFRDKELWPEKVYNLARTLENVILQTSDQNKQKGGKTEKSGSGLSIPDDVKEQLGPRPTESQMKSTGKEGKDKNPSPGKDPKDDAGKGNEDGKTENPGEELDGEMLEEAFKLNKNDPGKFAGTVGAFAPVEPDDALRLMYRMRAREYLIRITEKKNLGSYGTPAGYRAWNVGDPVLGRGGLEIIPSMASTGVMIPGISTIKRERQIVNIQGNLKQIPDMIFVVDSSGSMDWQPMQPNENSRGSFDKAIVATEAAVLYALDHGARAAIINFSGRDHKTQQRQIKFQDFTRDLNSLERAIMLHYNDGTIFPCETFEGLMAKNKNRVISCFLSDFVVDNKEETLQTIKKYTNAQNPSYLFDIGGESGLVNQLTHHPGVTRFPVKSIEDLRNLVIGRLRKDYEQSARVNYAPAFSGPIAI